MPRRTTNRKSDAPTTPLDLVVELMAIPGKSGSEGRVMQRIAGRLIAAGADEAAVRFDNAHKKTPLAGEVGNLVYKMPGTVRGPRRLLSAHVDTVPVCVGSQPVRRGSFIESADPHTGLGADDRAGAAVLLATAEVLLRQRPPHYPVTFSWTVQEEVGLMGARYLSLGRLGRPKLAFNFDGGSAAKLTVAATGGYRMKIDIHGIASHAGGAPEEGASAITIASIAIADLHAGGWLGLVVKGRRTGTSNVGVIEGGAATNVVTPYAELRAEARSHDPKFRERIVHEMEQAFQRAARMIKTSSGRRGRVEFTGQLDYEAFRLSDDDPSVEAAAAAVRAEGLEPERAVVNGGLDANWLTARGLPTVTLGCGQRNIHTVDEQLDIEQFELACRIAKRLVLADG